MNKVVLETGDPDPPVVEGDEDDVVDHPELGPEPARRPRAPHEGATVQPHCGSYSYNEVKTSAMNVVNLSACWIRAHCKSMSLPATGRGPELLRVLAGTYTLR